jgi:cyclohexanecarboxylate-CoA ligase
MIEADTLWDLVEKRANDTPDHLFGLDESGRSVSFAEYRDRSERIAAGLYREGIRPGTAVSWILPTSFDSLMLLAALARIGAVQNPIIPIYGKREVGFCLKQTGAEAMIVPGDFRGVDYEAMAKEFAGEIDGLTVIVASPTLPEADPADLPAAPTPESADDVHWVFYTSGTTADPKGARHTDSNILLSSIGMSQAMDLSTEDRIGMVFPVTHLGGANSLAAGLYSGTAHLIVEKFDPTTTIPFLSEHGVTHAGAGPAFWTVYLAAQRKQPDKPIFPKLRLCYGGGAAKPPQMHFDVKNELGGAGTLSVYGMTECPIISIGRLDDEDQLLAYTEGTPNVKGTEIVVLDPAGKPVATGAEGELRLKAPQLCKGYLDEKLNEEAWDENGYFITGDLGKIDSQGSLSITGRLKDVIIRKGENISALEIEDLIFSHPKVAEVAVIGLPDPTRGEMCCAIVTSVSPESPLELDEMVSFLKEKELMMQKIPERLEVVDELPKNATGKVLKKELKVRFSD